MDFDKTRVYTLYDAHELKVGSRGYFADTIKSLISLVQSGRADILHTFIGMSNDHDYIFEADNGYGYHLFYSVEEPEEKKFRPYRNVDEFISDYRKRFYPDYLGIPAIWVKNKADTLKQVVMMYKNEIRLTETHFNTDFVALLDSYNYPDGTQCGMEE